jgi:phage gp36-like protein
MAYCTRQDLVDRIGEELLVEASDLERTGVANEARITRAIADADAEIDAYAQARYSVPLAGPPDMIRKIAVDLALYGLFSARGIDPESADRSIVDGHRAALQFLDRLSRGHVTIGVATPAKDEGASVTAPSRIFTRDGMEGW